MSIPPSITSGVDAVWTDAETTDVFGDSVTSSSHSLVYYFRLNTAGESVVVTGTAYNSGWKITIPAATTEEMDPSTDWYFQAVLTKTSDSTKQEYSRGQIEVKPSLVFSGTAAAFDGRTQAKIDLDAVTAAIRALISGGAVQEYKIGNRNLKRYELPDLLQLEGKLKAEVMREKQADLIANGLGNPRNMFVRFN